MTTLARPYAIAAFEYALENEQLTSWEELLTLAATVAEEKRVANLLASHQLTKEQLSSLFCDVLKSVLEAPQQNFIHLLASNGRLQILPDILALFKTYRAQHEQTLHVTLASATPLDQAYQDKFVAALTKKLKRKIALQCETDPALLGGAIVRAGDLVIDGSVRGKLNRLLESIN